MSDSIQYMYKLICSDVSVCKGSGVCSEFDLPCAVPQATCSAPLMQLKIHGMHVVTSSVIQSNLTH